MSVAKKEAVRRLLDELVPVIAGSPNAETTVEALRILLAQAEAMRFGIAARTSQLRGLHSSRTEGKGEVS